MVTKVSDTVVDTMAEAQFKYLHHESSGLNMVISAGTLMETPDDGGKQSYPQQTLVLTDDSANYVYLEYDNTPATLEVSTEKPEGNIMLIHQVVTASGVISSTVDYRWKSINNRFLQDVFWPASEHELIFFRHASSATPSGFWIVRGLGTSRVRSSFRVPKKDAQDGNISSDDATTGFNAYGYWRSMSPDGLRMMQMRNVNGSATEPGKAYKRDTAGVDSDLDWVQLATLPDIVDDIPASNAAQIHYVEYNPVYQEFILGNNNGAGIGWLVYDDNEDDTYSVVQPSNSFDTNPNGAGQRTSRSAIFTPDGETWCTSSGNTIEFYSRETTGARYQVINTDTRVVGYSGPQMVYDHTRDEIVIGTRTTDPEKLAGYAFNGTSGNWEEQWEEDATTNTTWEYTVSVQEDYTINASKQAMYITRDGERLIVASNKSGGSYGLHVFTPRVGGGWVHSTDSTSWGALGDLVFADYGYTNLDYLTTIDGVEYFLVQNQSSFSASGQSGRIIGWDGSTFTLGHEMARGYAPTDAQMLDGNSGMACQATVVTKDGTVDDPADAIIMPYDPYWYWTPQGNIGLNNWDYDTNTAGWVNGEVDQQQFGTLQFDTGTIGKFTKATGPLANTKAVTRVGNTAELQILNGRFDQQDDLCGDSSTWVDRGAEGTLLVVWKTPAAWPAASDAFGTTRPLVVWGQPATNPTTQPNAVFGVAVKGVGASANLKTVMARDNSSREYLAIESSDNLALDTWYVTAWTQDGQGIKLYNNGVLEAQDIVASGDNITDWPGGWYAWLNRTGTSTKAFEVGSANGVGTTLDNIVIHAIAYYTTPLAQPTLAQITSSYGL